MVKVDGKEFSKVFALDLMTKLPKKFWTVCLIERNRLYTMGDNFYRKQDAQDHIDSIKKLEKNNRKQFVIVESL